MALIIKDRVKEITTTTGTGAVSLGGSSATFDAFQSVMSNGDTTFYAIVHTASGTDEWEVGVGTWNTGNTLTRTTVYAGSNGASAVNFSSGNKDIFMTYPASKAAVAGEDVTFADITATDITATGTVTLAGDPTTALGAATKEYVDTIAAAGIHYHTPVRVEAPSALTATYDNGTSGVGATLTNSGTQAALVIDGVTLSTSDRVLVYNQTNAAHNGVYTVTNTGSASTNWVLTRATDADSYGASDPDAMGEGDAYFVKEGDTGAGELYVMNTSGVITFGTTNITFTVIAETAVYSAGTGLTLTGTTFSTNQDISTSASPTFAGATFTGNVDFGDNDAVRLGAGNDLQIYHDGADSYITESNASGNLFIEGTNLLLRNTAGEYYMVATSDAGVALRYDNSTKFATTSTGIDVTGNITVSGTVDGRDVATDGTKLDGIETGATGDQTASEILTAIKTVDGVGSNLDADLLDGQQGSYYLNTGTTFSGDVSGTYNSIVVANDSHTHSNYLLNNANDTTSGILTVTDGVITEFIDVATQGNRTIQGLATRNTLGSSGGYGDLHLQHYGGNLHMVHGGGTAYVDDNAVFHDGYHPNADKWTTARTLSLSGDASGSVSWDGSANATLSVTVANDSHTHDGRYYTETEADSRFVNVTGDTMSGTLVVGQIDSGNPSAGTDDIRVSGYGILGNRSTFYVTNPGTVQIGVGSTHNADAAMSFTSSQNTSHHTLYEGSNRVFTDGYHPNADKWTTARTLSLSGDASGSVSWDGSANATLSVTVADDSHNHTWDNIDGGSVNGWGGLRHSTSNGYIDFGPANTSWAHIYTDRANFYFNKELYVNNMRVFNTGYHPNADKWTTARTLSLSGDASGSVSWDGSANATLSVTVANDSHSHSNYIRSDANDTSTGHIAFGTGTLDPDSRTSFSGGFGNIADGGGWSARGVFVSGGTGKAAAMASGGGNVYFGTQDGTNTNSMATWLIVPQSTKVASFTNTPTVSGSTIWHAANDGSGSGLDADLLDGVQGSSFLRSDAHDTASGAITLSLDGTDVLNFSANSANDNRGIAFNGRTAISADYNDGWLRLNNAIEFTSGVYIPSGMWISGTLDVSSTIRHQGDNDTSISFGTDTITIAAGGHSEITVNTSGVRLGDTGNGYFQPVSGNYGSIQIDGGAHGGWEGYSIGGRWVFMSNNTDAGIYNDIDNEWMAYFARNGAASLYYNGSTKLNTTSTGVSVIGTVAATSYTGDGSSLTGISAGASGGGSDEIFWENGQNVTSNYTITNGKNAMSAGPITINSGVTVTVGSGETWTVV